QLLMLLLFFSYTNSAKLRLLKRAKKSLKSANTNIYIAVYNIEVKALTAGNCFFGKEVKLLVF
ncbi:hypothetical protein, partial [uncultured Holdemanella sp.]|uniref:hypothetical protein n=1 Tax=uncultured Holdemanella sp. TaxID=1763549 RepID=UPI00265884F3